VNIVIKIISIIVFGAVVSSIIGLGIAFCLCSINLGHYISHELEQVIGYIVIVCSAVIGYRIVWLKRGLFIITSNE